MQGRRQCSCPPQLICEHYKILPFWVNRANSKTLKMTFKWFDPDPGGGTASPGGSTLITCPGALMTDGSNAHTKL